MFKPHILTYSGLLIGLWLLLAQTACQPTQCRSMPNDSLSSQSMIVAAHPLAADIGIKVLKQGGNAIDAAVATGFTLAVCYPVAGNLGGGGFMVLRLNGGTCKTLDYREKAPMKAHKDMFLDAKGNFRYGLSTQTHLASGVPGSVAGLLQAHQQYGSLSLDSLINPAIRLAQKGFPITKQQAKNLNSRQQDFLQRNKQRPAFVKNNYWQAGDTLKQTDLAHSLCLIRDKGRDGFYKGETADKIVAEMKRGGGLISHQDLADYRAAWRKPIIGAYKEYRIISMGPPSSGGIALVQLLNMVEPYPLKDWGFQTSQTMHLMVEAMRRVYADRAEYLGDADFYPVPGKGLTSKKYSRNRMENFSSKRATPSDSMAHGNPAAYESEQTTHYSIVDQWGNAVSVTTTLNGGYGSKIVVEGAGFLLNNEMDDFSAKPGQANMFGLLGNEANAIAGGKRMLSAMTPTIVEKNNRLFMVVGTPGGSTIITSVFQVILNVIEFKMTMQAAVSAPRFHHQWQPDVIRYEAGVSNETLQQLNKLLHKSKERRTYGRVDAILIKENGQLEGGADPRGDDVVRICRH